jgi:hypothetical protein
MTGPKLTALILFCALAFAFGVLFSIGITGGVGSVLTGVLAAAGTGALIWFAETGKTAFARGFLALGAVFIIVPLVALGGLGEQLGDAAVQAVDTETLLSEDEIGALALRSIFASAGLVFGLIVGMILVLIGGLMHRRPTSTPSPDTPNA